MRAPRLIALAMSALLAALGLGVLVAPMALAELGRWMQAPGALYAVAVVRVVFGVSLVWVASASRMPGTLRVLGGLIVVVGLITPLFGVERARAVLDWWVGQGTLFMRVWALLPIAFGIFLIRAIVKPRPAPGGSPPRS